MASSDAKYDAISQPYRFELELVSERPDLDLQSLLHQPAFLAFSPEGPGIHGLIFQVAQGESGKRLTRYTLSIVPQLSYLALRTNQRIFQHLTVPQIIAQVLEEHGIVQGGYQFLLDPTVYPKRDYCVQYDESAFGNPGTLTAYRPNASNAPAKSPASVNIRCCSNRPSLNCSHTTSLSPTA